MRSVAEEVGVAVGNIYRYFSSKDDLFVAICQPMLQEMDHYANEENSPYFQTLDVFTLKTYQKAMAEAFLVMVKKFRVEFRLLLFEAEGTPLENYFERFAAKQAEVGWKYIKQMKQKYPQININISPYFIQLNCIIWFDVLRIIIQNDQMTPEEVRHLVDNYINYGTGGWKFLFDI